MLYMLTWIPSIYPSHVSLYTIHGSYGILMIKHLLSASVCLKANYFWEDDPK